MTHRPSPTAPDGRGTPESASGSLDRRPAHSTWVMGARLLAASAMLGLGCGVAAAVFLWGLDRVTDVRSGLPALVLGLPLFGWLWEHWLQRVAVHPADGVDIRRGQGHVLAVLYGDPAPIPARMGIWVLVGTWATHLFGGSAGREGTAIQMGASLADGLSRRLRFDEDARRALVAAGMAGGFGAVFGTPWAGLVFAVETPVVGRWTWRHTAPCAVAAWSGHAAALACGTQHSLLPTTTFAQWAPTLTPGAAAAWIGLALAAGAAAALFGLSIRAVRAGLARWIPTPPLRMAVGGAIIAALWLLTGTAVWLGLGVPYIELAFVQAPGSLLLPLGKIVFTAITIGAGFPGGEVTPLFFVGATLGSSYGAATGLPLAAAAGIGMAAVFGAAARAPIALAIMAAELCGAGILPLALPLCLIAAFCAGPWGIYGNQRHRYAWWGRFTPNRGLAEN